MKVLYSQLKKYLPDLKADVHEVAEVFTMTGFLLDSLAEVEYGGKQDYLLDLEVRQNRADAFGVQGLARELSAYYDLPLVIPTHQSVEERTTSGYNLPIEVLAEDAVKRVMAVKLSGLKIGASPKWLIDYLAFYELNSINNLVDLTNYVMLETGHPSHAFDTKLVGSDKLVWEINPNYKKMVSLSGEEIEISQDALIVSDGTRPLSLSMVGGKEVAINEQTDEIILEIAIYDGGLVRRNGRTMKVLTEAGSRLEKFLDPESIPDALNMLVDLILKECGGEVTSKIYDNYLHKTQDVELTINLDKVQQVAGIEINYDESLSYLKRLGFVVKTQEGSTVVVKRPINRLDIEIDYDVFEEIIRLKGFDKIPKDKLTLNVTRDITPPHLVLIDKLQTLLANSGFDEVRSWVLVDEQKNKNTNYEKWQVINVTNSINEEVPYLRQAIGVSLLGQLETYSKNNINNVKLFELGKVFGNDGGYAEHNALGMLERSNNPEGLRFNVEKILRTIGFDKIYFQPFKQPPPSAHPKTCWSIVVDTTEVGILYLTNKALENECVIAEINIDLLQNLIAKGEEEHATHEITQKIVILDANVLLAKNDDIRYYLDEHLSAYQTNIWQSEVVDAFEADGKMKFTVRISYMQLSDPEAKELHAKIFQN